MRKLWIVFTLVFAGWSYADPLPSWQDGASKQAIINFVGKVTRKGANSFVPPAERIAVFDNDGTLWAEQPMYFQMLFAIERIKSMAADNPHWKSQQPYKAVLEDDWETLGRSGNKGIMQLVAQSHANMTSDEFDQTVRDWLKNSRHPFSERPYTEMVYQPMLEVLAYLRDNDFKTYIVSGGGVEFIRVFSEQVYGIPPEQVIGSTIETEYRLTQSGPAIYRLPQIDFINDKSGKPVAIQRVIGQKPIAAFGNSDGDLQMLEWTSSGQGERLGMIIHHTDDKREWAYDKDSHIGKLYHAMNDAPQQGWFVVDMKSEWKQIYPATK